MGQNTCMQYEFNDWLGTLIGGVVAIFGKLFWLMLMRVLNTDTIESLWLVESGCRDVQQHWGGE